ncbi:MAG: CopK family periplasmic copper-binding protein [Betaproteobacteria bacterium]
MNVSFRRAKFRKPAVAYRLQLHESIRFLQRSKMRLLTTLLLLQLLVAATSSGWAQSGETDRVIELKGGERVVVRADGSMSHYDGSGKSIVMSEGAVMIAKDGGRIVMKSQALWREILELAATGYAQATTGAIKKTSPDKRSIALRDGGRIVLGSGGAMAHYDAAGNRQGMADGEVMIAKDGSRILMVNDSLWRSEVNRDAPKPAR